MKIALLDAALIDGDLSFERGGETVNNPAFHLRRDDVGIHVTAAVHGANDAVHAHLAGFAVHADLRHFGDEAAERFHHGDAARSPGRKRFSPARFFGR